MNDIIIKILILIAFVSRLYHIANGCGLTSYCDLTLIGLYHTLIFISVMNLLYIFGRQLIY